MPDFTAGLPRFAPPPGPGEGGGGAASGGSDIAYHATVLDDTGKFFEDVDRRIDRLNNKLDTMGTKLDQQASQGATSKLATVASGVTDKVSGLGAAAAGVVIGVVSSATTFAIGQIAQLANKMENFIAESSQLRARADTLAVTLDVVGKNAGYSHEQMAEFEKGMRKTGISIIAARQSLAKMVESELDLSQATKLARVAQDAAVIAGTNSSEAFQRLIQGITTLQPRMFRTLGLTVNLNQEYQKWAQANRRNANELTYQEKKQIALNAALRAGANITGAYEAAMGTVGKMQGSLVRVTEDAKVAFGGFFQAAMGKQVGFTTEKLKAIGDWLEKNQDAVEAWGARFGDVIGYILERLDDLITFIAGMPSMIENVGMGLAKAIAVAFNIASPEEIEKRRSQLGTYFSQAIAMLIGFITASWQAIFRLGGDLAKMFTDVIWPAIKGDGETAHNNLVKIMADVQDTMFNFDDTFAKATYSAAEFTGAIERTKTPAEQLNENLANMAKEAAAFQEKLDTLTNGLDALYRKMQEDVEAKALKDARQAIEDALKESWAAEDLLRQHNERVQEIMQGASEAAQKAAQDHNQARLDIERDFQRQMRDMQARFEFDAQELARSRDAVGLLRLIRQNKFEVEQAKTAKQDKIKDANDNFQKQMADLDKQRAEQLRKLQEQEAKEQEERDRAAERERQLDQLHQQWEEEDRKRAYAKQLADLIKQMGELSAEQKSELQLMLGDWESYFGDLLAMAEAYQAQVNAIVTPATPGTASPGTGGTYSYGGNQINPNTPGLYTPYSGVKGQAGQVTELLTQPASLLAPTGWGGLPQIPTVAPSRSGGGDRTIQVNVTGDNLDPYLQRVLVQGLLEIERNRG